MTESIWRDYQAKLKTFIKRRINDPVATDEILQNVYLKIHTQLDSLKEESNVGVHIDGKLIETVIPMFLDRHKGSSNHKRFMAVSRVLSDFDRHACLWCSK